MVGQRPRLQVCKRGIEKFMYLVDAKSEGECLTSELAELIQQPVALPWRSIGTSVGRDKRPLSVPHFEKPLAGQSLVHAQDGVLIDGEVAGELTDRRQPVARRQSARCTERRDLLGDLP